MNENLYIYLYKLNSKNMKSVKHLKKFKVLVGTPHADRKMYCQDQMLAIIKSLTYPYYTAIIADNSDTRKNYKKIVKQGINAVWVDPHKKSSRRYIAESHEVIRRQAISEGVDFLFHLEDDIIPPLDIIERLMAHQKQVVSGMYFINQGHNSHLMIQDNEKEFYSLMHTRNVDEGRDINYVDGTLKQVYACGLGCTLIHKSVFTKIPFRYEEDVDAHPDTFFAHDLKQANIPQYLDTSILCEHNNVSWLYRD